MKIKLQFIIAMLIFGSIGIFVKWIDIPSVAIVQWRTIIGSLCILLFLVASKKKIDFNGIKKNIVPLVISGASIGCSWAFLFEAYKNTSVGMATIIYYTAPLMVFVLSPLIFKAKITKLQVLGLCGAFIGMLLVNIMEIRTSQFSFAIVCAFLSALLYAVIMITNKFIKHLSGLTSTLVQLVVAGIVMTVYSFSVTGNIVTIPNNSGDMWLMLLVGCIHTGVAMSLYISALKYLSPQNISVFSYIDPASALVFAFVFLQESLTWYQIVGAVLIFGGALFAQVAEKKKGL